MKLAPVQEMLTPRLRVVARLRDPGTSARPDEYGPRELARDTLGAVVIAALFLWLWIGSAGLSHQLSTINDQRLTREVMP